MNEPNIDHIATFTGKLNRVEKSKVKAALEAGKGLGQILDEIAIWREKVAKEEKIQDDKNAKIKNPCKPNTSIKPKPNPLTAYEKQEQLRKQIREKTNAFINLQNKAYNNKHRCKPITF